MADYDDEYFWRFRWGKPKKVKGGIRAQAKRFGNQWWAAKWLETIETFGPRNRVARGRSYARKGQVLDLKLAPGLISGSVQGSLDEPYEVEIFLKIPGEAQKKEILQSLRTPIYAATLLRGELPAEVNTLFEKAGIALFPTKGEGRKADCTCPDSGNPCKHIAAVYYLVSEELERNPFELLHLRGIPKEAFMPQKQKQLFKQQEPQPLPSDPRRFWRPTRLKEAFPASEESSKRMESAPILQRLGPFPFWRGELDFRQTLETIYQSVRELALSLRG